MTIIIRQITKRPAGEDIVRDRAIDADQVTVGRATHNDLFLGDLRVGLDHLVISASGSRLTVEADQGQTFVVGGRSQTSLTLNRGASKTILVGPFELALETSEDGLWRITVQRVEAEQALDEADVERIFTLKGTALGKRLPALVLFATVVVVGLGLPVFWFFAQPDERLAVAGETTRVERPADVEALDAVFRPLDLDRLWLSGGLSGGHENLEGNCGACHKAAFEHVTDATCVECHEDLIDHAEPGRLAMSQGVPGGFDGFIVQAAAAVGKEQGECADCHREHNGEDGVILSNSTLCTDCHIGIEERLPDAHVGDAGSFADLHPNFSVRLVETPGVEPVFQTVSLDMPGIADNSGLKFPHDVHLETGGAVANQAQALGDEFGFGEALVCEDCHTLEKGGLLYTQPTMEADCQMCHSLEFGDPNAIRRLPHGEPEEVIAIISEYWRAQTLGTAVMGEPRDRRRPGTRATPRRATPDPRNAAQAAEIAAAEGVERVFTEGGACYDCHTVLEPQDGARFDILPVTLVDRFMTRGTFDHEAHETSDIECGDCHEARLSARAEDVLLPGIDAMAGLPGGGEVAGCRDCHGDEHAGPSLVASACIDCHSYHDGEHGTVMTGAPREVRNGPGGFDPGRWRRIPNGPTIR